MRPLCAENRRSVGAGGGCHTGAALAREPASRLTAIVLSLATETVQCHPLVSSTPESVLSHLPQPLEGLFQGLLVWIRRLCSLYWLKAGPPHS